MMTVLLQATANRPGAIAILQLIGESERILTALTGTQHWPIGRVKLASFADIDEGLAVRLTEDVAQLMPHGGPRVVQRLTSHLLGMGVELANASDVNPLTLYPEAKDEIEALMLHALSRAESPLAIDILLDQPRRWRDFLNRNLSLHEQDRLRSVRLNRLIEPPVVVLTGRPNVGKSTLSNALHGRSMSIAFDMPGTTRDYTAGRIDLGGLVVDWHDTPGLHNTNDTIESKAIDIARRLIDRADLLIEMRDPQIDWPDLPKIADIRVMNKVDLFGDIESHDADVAISAANHQNIAALVQMIREKLVPVADLENQGVWVFDERLLDMIK